MKKTSILASVTIAVLLLAYFAQVYFMSEASQKAYEKLVAYKHPYYTILDINITKGLFNSKAEFLVKINGNNILDSTDENEQSYEVIRFLKTLENIDGINLVVNTKNNVFAKNNIEILLANPSYDEKSKGDLASIKYPVSAYFDLSLSAQIKGDLTLKLADMDVKMGKESLLSQNTYLVLKDFSSNELKFGALELNSDKFIAGSKRDKIDIQKLNYVENFKQAINIAQHHDAYVLGKGFFESKGVFSLEKLSFQGVDINKLTLETQIEKNNEESFNMPFKFSIAEIANAGMNVKNIKFDLNTNNISSKWFNTISSSQSSGEFYFDLFASTSPKIELNDFSITINDANISAKAQASFTKDASKANANVISDKKLGEIHLMFALLGFDSMFVQKDGKYVLDFIYDDSDKNNITAKLNENDISQAFKNIPYGFNNEVKSETDIFEDENLRERESEINILGDENLSDEEGIFDGEVKNPNSTN